MKLMSSVENLPQENFLPEARTPVKGKFADLNRRPSIAAIAALGENLVGAEVGVQFGDNAAKILAECSIQRLTLIDHWAPYVQKDFNWDFGYAYPRVVERFKDDPRVEILKMDSLSGAKKFDDESLDFVYLDTCHDEEPTLTDIGVWFPKVKMGGILAGHDFSQPWPGVVMAVLYYQRKYDWDLCTRIPDWWTVKEGSDEWPVSQPSTT